MTTRVIIGDCRERLRDLDAGSVQCIVTSPPYFGLRDYGVAGQIGMEATPDAFVAELVAVFREARRVLADDGVLFLNLGDSYGSAGGDTYSGFNQRWSGTGGAGSKQDATLDGVKDRERQTGLRQKNLLGIPWRVAFALQADGWWLRQDIIWAKPNPMPESVRDRCTKAHEYVFLLTKAERYYWDADAIAEPAISGTDLGLLRGKNAGGVSATTVAWHAESIKKRQDAGVDSRTANPDGTRNARSVWSIPSQPYSGAHFATMPPALAERCILAGSRKGDWVLDPFGGAGTTAMVADRLQRHAISIELNPAYAALQHDRMTEDGGLFAEVAR